MRFREASCLVLFAFLGSACATTKLIHSKIGNDVPWHVTSQPSGAMVSVRVTNEGTGGEASFTITTPYLEEKDKGLVEYIVTPDGVRRRQLWHITVTKAGYQTLVKDVYSDEVPAKFHFELVAEGVAETKAPAKKESVVLAVFDVEDKSGKISPEVLEQFSEYLATQLSATGVFQIVPRSELRSRLTESKAETYRACFDEACQIELGKALAAQLVLSTRILKVGEQCAVSGSLHNLKSETSVGAASVRTDCSTNTLLDAADKIASELAKSR